MAQDSHTPGTLKLQMALAALSLLTPCRSADRQPGVRSPSYAGLGFGLLAVRWCSLLTEIPFLVKAWRRDRGVVLPAVGLLWARAFALGTGFALGVVRFRRGLGERRPPISGLQRVVEAGDGSQRWARCF